MLMKMHAKSPKLLSKQIMTRWVPEVITNQRRTMGQPQSNSQKLYVICEMLINNKKKIFSFHGNSFFPLLGKLQSGCYNYQCPLFDKCLCFLLYVYIFDNTAKRWLLSWHNGKDGHGPHQMRNISLKWIPIFGTFTIMLFKKCDT